MKFFNDEKAVSEIVGAMMILLIIVLYIGTLQSYEVPKWNKELERQAFDKAYSDFVSLRSNIEDASIKNVPRTSGINMGVRYPERFMLRNPGAGGMGSITSYPLKINVSYMTANGTLWRNFTSMGLIYQMKGVSESPRIIYENGIIITDYENGKYSDDINRLTTGNNIFIPILNGSVDISSMSTESLNILPIPSQNYTTPLFSEMNITIETRYPEIWAKFPNSSRPSGSKFSVDIAKKTINIKDINGFNVTWLSLPDMPQSSGRQFYAGMITYANPITGIGSSGNCASPGQYMSKKDQGCIDLVKSASVSKFIIKDISMVSDTSNAELRFSVSDFLKKEWEMSIRLESDSTGNPSKAITSQKKPSPGCDNTIMPLPNGEIDLTTCYQAAGIMTPNVLTIKKIDGDILHANFMVK